jgi:hypothetical protein
MTGTAQMKLTVASVDGELSKPIAIAGTATLVPHVGYQWIHIWGDSGTIDLTPNTDPLVQCGYAGHNTPATPDPNKSSYDGQPVCSGSSADFNNNVVFDNVRLQRHRITFGLQFNYQMVHVGLSALTDLVAPVDVNKDETSVPDPSDPTGRRRMTVKVLGEDPRTNDNAVTKQWTVSWELGAAF